MIEFFSYGFINNALLTALIGSISCGLIGTYIVSKRLVFITGGITHASFGGLGIGYFLGIPPLLGAGIFGSLAALIVEYLSGKNKVRVDSAIAMAWSFGMAIGIIFIFITPGYAPNLMSYLFGSILTVSRVDIWIMLVLMVMILTMFLLFFRQIQFIAFDSDYARSQGVNVNLLNYILIILVALTAVLYIRVAGIILVLSLLTVPQNMAMLFTNKFKKILYLSIIFGFIGSVSGLIMAWFLDIPSGAAIIFTLVLEYIIGSIIVKLRNLHKRRLKIS
ncbi:MAG: metal ABC transporter permease [Bacteroidales bacterium]|nr:metal ABC transporter permease [Bacteroidales bacterium]